MAQAEAGVATPSTLSQRIFQNPPSLMRRAGPATIRPGAVNTSTPSTWWRWKKRRRFLAGSSSATCAPWPPPQPTAGRGASTVTRPPWARI